MSKVTQTEVELLVSLFHLLQFYVLSIFLSTHMIKITYTHFLSA